MIKNLLLAGLALTLLTVAGCKKKNPCEEEWPDGFEFYETTGSDDEPTCTTPIIVGRYKHNPTGPRYQYNIRLTPQQGVCDIQLNGPEIGHFAPPISYTLSPNNNSSNGNLDNAPNIMQISVNQQWNSEVSLYWRATDASATIHAIDTAAGTASISVEYTLAPVGTTNNAQSFRMEMDDYEMPWNPH